MTARRALAELAAKGW
ncbi:hypothetical protein MJ585_01665 [Klebsiella pneumoniae]|nr:hypothetical protein MJ585_01665 [Klebsiella pneumoniae]